MIGIDPHERTHTAVAVDAHEVVVAERLVQARAGQVTELVAWADTLGDRERIWAIESAGGLGYLLSQQLLAAGEHVVDIPATLASRVRVLSSGRSDKNDPNDARSVAVAALRAPTLVPVRGEDHRSVLRLLSRRHTQLSWTRNKAACRLHALICDLTPGGIGKELVVAQALWMLDGIEPAGAPAIERHRLALELVDDIKRLDHQRKTSTTGIRAAVTASGTTLTDIFGVGDVVAATLIGHTGDPFRFANQDPLRRVQRHRTHRMVLGEPEASHPSALATREPRDQPRAPHRRGDTDPLRAQSRSRLLRPQTRRRPHSQSSHPSAQRRVSNIVYQHLIADAQRPTQRR